MKLLTCREIVGVSTIAEEVEQGPERRLDLAGKPLVDFVESPKGYEGKVIGRATIEPREEENDGQATAGPTEVWIPKSEGAQAGMIQSGNIAFVVRNWGGGRMCFTSPPSMVDKKIVGKGRPIDSNGTDWREVSFGTSGITNPEHTLLWATWPQKCPCRAGT